MRRLKYTWNIWCQQPVRKQISGKSDIWINTKGSWKEEQFQIWGNCCRMKSELFWENWHYPAKCVWIGSFLYITTSQGRRREPNKKHSNVFPKIAKCFCQNCKTYLSKRGDMYLSKWWEMYILGSCILQLERGAGGRRAQIRNVGRKHLFVFQQNKTPKIKLPTK